MQCKCSILNQHKANMNNKYTWSLESKSFTIEIYRKEKGKWKQKKGGSQAQDKKVGPIFEGWGVEDASINHMKFLHFY